MKKLRPFYPADKLHELYGHAYQPDQWIEHKLRLDATIDIAVRLATMQQLHTVADLSCGDRTVVNALHDRIGMECVATNDITTGVPIDVALNEWWNAGPDTLPVVDLFICTETIEHLEAPWTVLEKIAAKTKWLLLSTPLDEKEDENNWEHYWSFTSTDVAELLRQSRFNMLHCDVLMNDHWVYRYQVWTGRSELVA